MSGTIASILSPAIRSGWVPLLCEKVASAGQTAFYKALLALVRDLIRADVRLLAAFVLSSLYPVLSVVPFRLRSVWISSPVAWRVAMPSITRDWSR